MFRPLTRPPRTPRRSGTILVVVLALLALFAVIGISFVFYADSEATAARIHREAVDRPDLGAPDTSDVVTQFLSALIYDVEPAPGTNPTPDKYTNALRGHSLLRAMYGWTNQPGQNTVPYNGVGTFHDTIDLSPAGIPFTLPDRARVVNYTFHPYPIPTNAGLGFVLDPEYTGVRVNPGTGVSAMTNVPVLGGGRTYIGRNAPYTYPDLKDFYLASISPATGEVLVKSFHRDWLFNGQYTIPAPNTPPEGMRLAPWNPNVPAQANLTDWITPAGRTRILRPRPVDQLTQAEITAAGVPYPLPPTLNAAQQTALFNLINSKIHNGEIMGYPPMNADGSYTGDAQNLPGGVGVQRNDSLFLDLGLPEITYNGKKVKPLVAALVLDTNGRVNLNVAGNVRNSGNHGSTDGYGPWDLNLARVFHPLPPGQAQLEANSIVGGRYAPASLAARNGTAARAFDPTGTRLPGYALVSWDPVGGGRIILPSFDPAAPGQLGTALQTSPAYIGGGYDDNTTLARAANHPSLFNPAEWLPRGSPGRTFPAADLKRLMLRMADRRDYYTEMDVGPLAPANLVGTTFAGPLYPQFNFPNPYRLDPSHPKRLLVTTVSSNLDWPGLAPNYLNIGPAGQGALQMYVSPDPPQPYPHIYFHGPAATMPGPFPPPGATTGAGITDILPGDYRNVRAALGPVDVNRRLADYRGDVNLPLSPVNMANWRQAWADRHNLARDVFARLIVATGADATVFTQDTVVGAVTFRAGDVLIQAAPGSPEFEALRYLAQIAANIVDYVDNDDVNTPFVWNPRDPGDPTIPLPLTQITDPAVLATPVFAAQFDSTGPSPTALETRVVFGTEKPRLVINEAYAEITNDPSGAVAQPAQVRFWVELLNPTNSAYPAGTVGPLGNAATNPRTDGAVFLRYDAADVGGGVPFNPYQLVITRFARTGVPVDVPTALRAPSNVTGAPPNGFDPDIVFNFGTVPPNGRIVGPNNGSRASYNPLGVPAAGIAVVGPPVTASTTGIEFVPPGEPPWNNLIQSGQPMPSPHADSMAYTIPMAGPPPVDQAYVRGPQLRRHVVLLRRLANPYLPPNAPGAPGYNPALPPNPFITVDYMDHVPAHDAMTRLQGGDGTPRPERDPMTGTPAHGYTRITERFSVGKVQPYAAHAQAGLAADNITPTYTFPTSLVLAQRPIPPAATEQPRHTFGRHNGQSDGGRGQQPPGGPTYTLGPPAQMLPVPTETLMLPFDWLVHFDRPLINQLELLHVSAGKPHELTQLFLRLENPLDPTTRFRKDLGQVPWLGYNLTTNHPGYDVANNRTNNALYRALGLIKVKPWGYGVPLGGKVHGLVNLNTIQHPDVLYTLVDPQAGSLVSKSLGVSDLWANLIGSPNVSTGVQYRRTHTVQTRTLPNPDTSAGGGQVQVPIPGPTVHDLQPDDPLYPTADRPFLPLGAPEWAPWAGGANPRPAAFAGGSGINDTLLRLHQDPNEPADPNAWAPVLWLDRDPTDPTLDPYRTHPYFRSAAARKLLNNVTTVSDTFTVTFTVAFFEVRTDPATGNAYTEPGTGRTLLGKEVYREVPGDLRQQFFAVIDRANATLDPTDPSLRTQGPRPFFTKLEASVTAPPSAPMGPPPPPVTLYITHAGTGGLVPGVSVTVYADGQPVTVAAGTRLVLGTGADQEIVQVASVGLDGGLVVTLPNGMPITRNHAAGSLVSNVRLGNPGPQDGTVTLPDGRTNKFDFANPYYQAVVPYVTRVR